METNAINSWAIRWWWAVFKKEGFVLYPDKSLVKNIGWDNSGTHSGTENPFEGRIGTNLISLKIFQLKFQLILCI